MNGLKRVNETKILQLVMYRIKNLVLGQDTAGNSPFPITFKGFGLREMVRKKCYGSLSQFAATKGPLMRNNLIWIDSVQINHGLKNESDACQELGIMVTREHRFLVLGSKQAGVYSRNSGWPLRALFNPISKTSTINFQPLKFRTPWGSHYGKVDPNTS